MKAINIAIFFLLIPALSWGACDCASTDQANPCTGTSISITVDGTNTYDPTFSWTFNSGGGSARCGQFANGDYWVAPASGQSSVQLTTITTTTPGTLTADVNPRQDDYGLLDGTNAYNGYDSSENIISSLPISYSSDVSIVAASQRNEAVEGQCNSDAKDECTNAYHVVTILTAVPPGAGSTVLRPPIVPTTKTLVPLSDFDLSRLPSEAYLTGATEAQLELIRVRWSHNLDILNFGWSEDGGTTYIGNSIGGRSHRAFSLVNDYAAGAAKAWSDDVKMLMSSSTASGAAKNKAIYALLTYGLDNYAAMFSDPSGFPKKWGSGAGQHLGKFPPVVFAAGLEVGNTARQDNVKTVGSLTSATAPQEFAQLHVGTNGPVWGDMDTITRYWNDYIWANCWDGHPGTCDYNVGQKTSADPHMYIDGPPEKPGTTYFEVASGGILDFAAICILIPEMQELAVTTKHIDFAQRIKTHGLLTAPDPCIRVDTREDFGSCSIWTGGTGCDYYSPTASVAKTWGPKGLSYPDPGCETTEGTYTTAGRFTSLDGTTAPISTAYSTADFRNNWSTIYSEYQQTGHSSRGAFLLGY